MPQFKVKAIKKSGDENWLQMIATDTNTEIKVFDNSPLIGTDDFSFMQAGKSYACQIGLLCDVVEANSANQTMMSVVGKTKVGATAWWVVADDHNMQWLIPAKQKLPEKRKFAVDILRYNLLKVNDVVHSAYMPGGVMSAIM